MNQTVMCQSRTGQPVTRRLRKADWLSRSRWRSEIRSKEETIIYFLNTDGIWEKRFVLAPSSLGKGVGRGVYAAKAFNKGETLTYYGGNDLGKMGTEAGEAALKKARQGPVARYILNLGGRYIESDLKNINPAHLINDAGHRHVNAECKGGGEMKAKKNIRVGDELFWCYGAAYWRYWGARKGCWIALEA